MTKPAVGSLVYPLDWTGARLTFEPVAVVRTWTDASGNAWVGLADGRNFLAELCEAATADGESIVRMPASRLAGFSGPVETK